MLTVNRQNFGSPFRIDGRLKPVQVVWIQNNGLQSFVQERVVDRKISLLTPFNESFSLRDTYADGFAEESRISGAA